MICEKCRGTGLVLVGLIEPFEISPGDIASSASLHTEPLETRVCPGCGGSGIAYCCEG